MKVSHLISQFLMGEDLKGPTLFILVVKQNFPSEQQQGLSLDDNWDETCHALNLWQKLSYKPFQP